MDRVQIFDTTLRDGEQSPGATMNIEEKLVIARQLERLGVDVIEAGFAASSEGDFEAVRRVASVVTKPVVLSLARTREQDLDRAIRAVEKAAKPGIHIFVGQACNIQLKHKLMMSRQDVLDAAVWAVTKAKQHVDHIEFSAEDASRSDPEYMMQVFAAVIAAGASVINVPDTTGYALPEEYGALFKTLRERVPGAERVTWSAHCHNDLGMAVANSLAAVRNGARQIECTVNGIGERAGNTAMEEVVMAIKTRGDRFQVETGVVSEIYGSSRLVSQITGIAVPINKAVVGENAFAHEAGIHQDGVLKYRQNYEIMTPESVGLSSNRLVLGKHSGRHAFVNRLKELGMELADLDRNVLFDRFKALADTKKNVYDEDLIALVAQESTRGHQDRYTLVYLNVTSSSMAVPHATVKLRIDGEEVLGHGVGDGMVDACFKVIGDLAGQHPRLERYAVKAITGGTDAQGEVSVLVSGDDITVTGQSSHTDIIQASALAFVSALNKLDFRRAHRGIEVRAEVGP